MIRSITLLSALLLAHASFAGPLTPPGAPAPTMKTLHEVEPSTPINATNTPGDGTYMHVINQPGAYHFTEDLVGAAGMRGIFIEAPDVTIDMRGFNLDGLGGAGAHGIISNSLVDTDRARVLNGSVTNWFGSGVLLRGDECVVSGVQVSQIVGGNGISVENNSLVSDCVVTSCSTGIEAGSGSIVTSCISNTNSAHGISLFGATARGSHSNNNTLAGFWGGLVVSCHATGNDIGFDSTKQAVDCVAENNTTGFFEIGSAVSCRAVGGTNGFDIAQYAQSCSVEGADTGFLNVDHVEASRVLNTRVGYDMPDNGVMMRSSYDKGTGGNGNGINVGNNTTVVECTVTAPGSYGIRGAGPISGVDIRDCVINDSANTGIRLDGSEFTITGCTINNPGGLGIQGGDSMTIAGCVITNTVGNGIEAGDNVAVEKCRLDTIGGSGMLLGQRASVRGCDVSNTTNSGIVVTLASVVDNCLLANIGFYGISANESSLVTNNSLNNCQRHGIVASTRCTIRNNNIDFTGFGGGVVDGTGILCNFGQNRVENNNVTRADYGIRTLVASSVIIGNSVSQGSLGNYSTVAGDVVGPIVNSGTIGGASSSFSNISY
jgi:hypothetical protein